MARYAVLDIGSNSVKLYAARVVHGRVTPLADRLVVTRLAAGLDEDGDLTGAAMARTVDAVTALRREAEALGVEKVVAVGTEALRRAGNAGELLDLLRRRARLRVRVLEADQEAALAWEAARRSLPDAPNALAVFDAGGASTELVDGRDGRPVAWGSVPLGVRSLAERHRLEGRADDARLAAALATARAAVAALPRVAAGRLAGIGGTPHTLASLRRGERPADPWTLNGEELARDDVQALADRLRGLSLTERRRLPGLLPERADVALAGAVLVLALLDHAGLDAFTVSAAGLRHAVFHREFLARGR